MAKFARIAPPYCQVLIADEISGQVPILTSELNIVATSSCIAVGCLAFIDGETNITLGLTDEVNPGREPDFACALETPRRKIAIQTAEDEIILEVGVERNVSAVSVWVNDPSEPDDVIVGVS